LSASFRRQYWLITPAPYAIIIAIFIDTDADDFPNTTAGQRRLADAGRRISPPRLE
jgi:hypothetical protein